MFSLDFKSFNKTAMLMKLNMPYDYNTIHCELEKETNWANGHEKDWPYGGRSKIWTPDSPILKDLLKFLELNSTRKTLIDNLYQHVPNVAGRWRWSPDEMYLRTSVHGELTRDDPGFVNEIHIDSKFLIATGVIYLHDHDDPNLSTYFHSNMNGDNTVRVSGGFSQGWMHFNDIDSWHSAINETDNFRYTILVPIALHFKML